MAQSADSSFANRFGRLALDCVHLEYPNKISHVLQEDADARPPRELTPAFYGCFDWHSSVHGHWLLARLARRFPDLAIASEARTALGQSLTSAHLEAEVQYMSAEGRSGFERPYGLAWLLQLSAELHEWEDPQAQEWANRLDPLVAVAVDHLRAWIPKLSHPIRIGEHAQTAFAFGLITDYTRVVGDTLTERIVREASMRFYMKDQACPLGYEPSGHDFLSPCLAEADLMRRFLTAEAYAIWLQAFLPQIGENEDWLPVATVTDATDGKLAHLDGLNLSRAWMLEGMMTGLPDGDSRKASLKRAATAHRKAGFEAVTGAHYAGGHWLGSFAMYLLSGRGL